MKMSTKIFSCLLIAFTAMMITAFYGCGNKKSAIAKVKPEKIEISGDLADYIQVIDNEYEITDDWGGNLSIKIKAVQAFTEEEMKNKDFEISASLLDDKSMPVSGVGEFKIEYESKDKLLSLLKKGSGEEVIQLKALLGDYKAEEHAEKSKMFTVSSSMKEKEQPAVSSSESSDNPTVSDDNTTSSTDCDQFLKEYEAFADSYIKLLKKYKKDPSDASILNEYTESAQKAIEMQNNVTNCTDAKYASKLTKIATKIANAAADLQ